MSMGSEGIASKVIGFRVRKVSLYPQCALTE